MMKVCVKEIVIVSKSTFGQHNIASYLHCRFIDFSSKADNGPRLQRLVGLDESLASDVPGSHSGQDGTRTASVLKKEK